MEQKHIQCAIYFFFAIYITQISSRHQGNNDIIIQGQHDREVKEHEVKSYDIDDNDEFVNYRKNKSEIIELIRKRREISDWFIAPNTHWCGRGNTANGTYNQLGGSSSADKCCRTHDHCQYSIPALSTRYELFNYRPYTLSYCLCDRRFRTCLKMASDLDSNTIGKIFFNMVQKQCFVLRTQKVCQERDENGTCVRHYLKKQAKLKDNKGF